MPEIHELDAAALARLIEAEELAPTAVVEAHLDRIARLDGGLGAFVEVTADAARERARSVRRGLVLSGVPFADKDLTARAGVPTRYGSRAFRGNVPSASDPFAAAIDRTGAISLGKTNTPEFGMTGYTEAAVAPPARNPWDPSTGAGGSSGGAAVAVAAGLLPWAAASDGGGSIRIPAATCGVVGLKPSRGRLPIGSGLDAPEQLAVNGAVTRSVADAGFLLDVLTGLEPYPYAVGAPGADGGFATAAREPATGALVGVTLATPWDGDVDVRLDADAAAAVRWAADALASAGPAVEEADWRPTGYPALFRTLWRSSAARIPLPDSRLDELEPITAWLVREGRALPASAVLGALAAARTFERQTIAAFARYDAVLTPALAMSPRPVGWYDTADAERAFEQQVQYAPHTSWVNVAGLPAITVPVVTGTGGQPVSVQLVGRPGGEAAILALAAVLEQARGPLPHPPAWSR